MKFIKNFYHLILRKFPKLFAFIYAILFSLTYKVLKKKKNKKKRILLLSRERFREDSIARGIGSSIASSA